MMGTTLFIDPGRCIGCQACVAACRECDSHRGKSMIHLDYIDAGRTAAAMPTVCMHCEDPAEMLQYTCNLCYDRSSVGLAPMCATVCPTSAIFYGSIEELEADRPGAQAIDVFRFGEAEVRTGCAVVAPEGFSGPAPGGM
jgi:Fe-S-cluster-containing dehydrogenase component